MHRVRFGRPTKEAPNKFPVLIKKWEQGKISAQDVALACDMSIATFYRRLREYRYIK